MCHFVIRDDEVFETMGELEELVPREDWVYDPVYGYEHYDPECCLCPLDLQATMKRAGYSTTMMDSQALIVEKEEVEEG